MAASYSDLNVLNSEHILHTLRRKEPSVLIIFMYQVCSVFMIVGSYEITENMPRVVTWKLISRWRLSRKPLRSISLHDIRSLKRKVRPFRDNISRIRKQLEQSNCGVNTRVSSACSGGYGMTIVILASVMCTRNRVCWRRVFVDAHLRI